jgi:melibiose permease
VCAVCLIFFSSVSVASTKETVVPKASEKFSFKKTFEIIKSNDQLLVFMLFAMISNAGWYLTSGVATYYFDVVVGDPNKQSMFSTSQAVGSVVGMLLLPFLTKIMSKRKAYQTSLILCTLGYTGMAVGAFTEMAMLMNICYCIGAIGMSSMFIAQTIFLADVVDYGEVKMGFRAESITFSMKGFLQKMAYTIQTIVLFGGLGMMNYNEQIKVNSLNDDTKSVIGIICFAIPPVLMVVSLLIFRFGFKLHGELRTKVHDHIAEKRAEAN